MSRPVLQVIVGSTRPGRVGRPIADWFHGVASSHGAFDVELVDLAEVDLPLFDEPRHPRLGDYEHEHTRRWSDTISRGDAYVFDVPEYNHGYNAAVKNAIDFLFHEWQRKPIGFVSYGGVAGGTRAVQQLKTVAAALKMVPLPEAVYIPMVGQVVRDGEVRATDVMGDAAGVMLDELARWSGALEGLRPTD
ncbi:NADPH-dependent FMN reductase [Actinomarinicola tropica]|uniref:NADPH-dependent FMN reductase n=1 Tax=Actinomarinicola tropica TaxID=2789776 RepID=A0A5Q2RC97_9ACTN|nr:NAD(P)H-dependent oxidoreductase [Actinomarinicola tropica]QGG94468.1 NADPH-dependent FMN reductase [Actinomarinicola tropica]